VGTLGGNSGDSPTEAQATPDVASVDVAITTVPASVLCIKVVATNGGQVVSNQLLGVTGGTSSATVGLGQLPTGNTAFQGSAYTLACASVVSTTVANWVSDPVSAVLTAGYRSTVTMNFRQINPVTVSANFAASVQEISTGGNSTLARLGDGTVLEWGAVGITMTNVPTAVPSLTNVAQVVGGNSFECARKTDGTVWCWGYNQYGALGPNVPLNTFAMTPVQITLNGPMASISAGTYHMCALGQNNIPGGLLYCWGYNADGELGNGTTTNSLTPVYSRSGVGTVSAGAYHTCITDGSSGAVLCTGNNSGGQLGNGTQTNSTSWTSTGLVGAVAVSSGYLHTCAIMGDNTARCFGSNNVGAIGDGTTTTRLSPVAVTGLSNVAQIQSGEAHTCALLLDGTVHCWGYGPEVGTGQSANALTQVQVPGLAGVLAVHSSQGSHTCVEMSDHTVKCWGSNEMGQIGDGTNVFAPLPKTIQF
jgi:alpha-tubulin suppressor-like RCC1 family protein